MRRSTRRGRAAPRCAGGLPGRGSARRVRDVCAVRRRAAGVSRASEKKDVPHVDAPTTHRHRRESSPKGALVLIGGAISPHGHALRSFLDLIGARGGGRIVGLTTASSEPDLAAQEWLTKFRSVGAFNVEIP